MRRALAISFGLFTFGACLIAATVAGALRSGPIGITLPGGASLSAGSEDFVLADYSFQQGATYFIDLKGNGVRGIVEFQRPHDGNNLSVVLSTATTESQSHHRLITVPWP